MYDVYGVGNALVDFEFEVSDNDLLKWNIEKGLMTLIEEERHYELLDQLKKSQHSRACGGSAANTVIAVTQLGSKSFYSCKVGNDETGEFFINDLRANGVETNMTLESRAEGATGKCLVMITPDAERTMNTFLGITSEVSEKELSVDSIAKSDIVYVEGYLVSSPTALNAALEAKRHAKANHKKIAVSLSDVSMVKFFREGLEQLVGEDEKVDILFCNANEAFEFTGTDTIEAAVESLKLRAEHFIITLGAEGSVFFDGRTLQTCKPFAVSPIDTNGAGDLFAGAFLFGLTQGWPMEKSAHLASYASSVLVTQFGPRLNAENLAKVKAFMHQM
ncbi:MAG: adenosine kinase [Pseudomonadota bacterium]